MRKKYHAPCFELLTVKYPKDVLLVSVPPTEAYSETSPPGYDPVETPDDF